MFVQLNVLYATSAVSHGEQCVCDWAQLRTDGQAGEYADGQAAAGGQGRFGWLALLLGSQLGWLSCLVLS